MSFLCGGGGRSPIVSISIKGRERPEGALFACGAGDDAGTDRDCILKIQMIIYIEVLTSLCYNVSIKGRVSYKPRERKYMIVFEDGGGYRWETADMFDENKWHLDASVEDLVVRGVNLGLYGRKYEGKYTIFYNRETGANIARRSRK